MIRPLLDVFRTPPAEQILRDQLEDAKRNALMHEAAAEHHDALALMYRARVDRLTAQLEGQHEIGPTGPAPFWSAQSAA